MKTFRILMMTVLLAVGAVAVACGTSTNGQVQDQAPAVSRSSEAVNPTLAPVEVSTEPRVDGAVLTDGVTVEAAAINVTSSATSPGGYDSTIARTEAYWYSRFNLASLVMRSGMGIQLKPPMEMRKKMMEMAGITEAPANPYLLQAVYRSGDPYLIREFNGDANDFSNYRWDPDLMDTTVTPQAMAYTIVKEIIWAKSFATDVEGPDPMNHFRALILSTEAAAQAGFAAGKMRSPEGLFVGGWRAGKQTDSSAGPQDQIAMLWALSELSDYATGNYGFYAAPVTSEMASGWADGLVGALRARIDLEPEFLNSMPTRDIGVALAALSAYAGYAADSGARAYVVEELIPRIAAEIIGRTDDEGRLEANGGFSQVASQSTAISGLVFASRIVADESYSRGALHLWGYMETLWDDEAKVYIPSPGDVDYTYAVRDVGDIVGALNALINGLGVGAEERLAEFFFSAVNASGLQIAEGEATGGGADGDSIPGPAGAGGLFGRAPVLATEVVYRAASGSWEVTNPIFTTSDAMLANSHFMWVGIWGSKASVAGNGIPIARSE